MSVKIIDYKQRITDAGKAFLPSYFKEVLRSLLPIQLESYTPPITQAAIDDAKAGMFNLLALPMYVFIFFILPWVK
jgi:hypothetical protein